MNLPPDDLDRAADEHLDGLIDDATWVALEARHGNAIAIALHQARERRAAVAALSRPALPTGLRERLLPPTRAPLRFPWRVVMTAAIAACLVILVLPRLSHTDPEPSAPDQVREKRAADSGIGSSFAHREKEAPAAAVTAIDNDDRVVAELAEAARTSATADTVAALPPTVEAIGPHAIALAWAPRRRDAQIAAFDSEAGASEAESRQRAQKTRSEETADAAPAAAARLTAPSPTAMNSALAATSSTGPMVVVLHNRTISPWAIAADHVRLEARDATGTVVWSGSIDAIGTLTVAPGGFLSLTVEHADWPATAHSVRAVLGELVSADLGLESPTLPE